ncbi:hypothetical protein OVA24_01120 [Luteolibacter sp. SL250]|uniref:hypothetical protein n=1 Tax=Luteolibacter sp. SL250 TaxID=2995170 RepID=UPI002270C12E|nr:hypothetical protein [Luteolibacter sp. SL250]WAC19978.1 hypothetical protein OVA24_01120 [Luteolibacter sp. SL250]
MKPSVILPIVTALAGFGVGWLVKPAPPAAIADPSTTRIPDRKGRDSAPAIIEPSRETAERPPAEAGPQARREPPEQTIENIASRDDAKLARLTEALNLNDDQKAQVLNAIEAARATLEPEGGIDAGQLLDTAVKAGADLEKAILATLTPEQATAFTALRKRLQDNSVETASQEQASKFAALTDLSPEQRDMILERIRGDVRKEHDERPQGLDLVLDTSPLPTGSAYLAASSVASLPYMSGGDDANGKIEAFRDLQRRNLDAQMEKYKDILTPAQLSRLQLDIEEKKRILDLISERTGN